MEKRESRLIAAPPLSQLTSGFKASALLLTTSLQYRPTKTPDSSKHPKSCRAQPGPQTCSTQHPLCHRHSCMQVFQHPFSPEIDMPGMLQCSSPSPSLTPTRLSYSLVIKVISPSLPQPPHSSAMQCPSSYKHCQICEYGA